MVIHLPKTACNSCNKWRVSHDKACTIQHTFPFSHINIYTPRYLDHLSFKLLTGLHYKHPKQGCVWGFLAPLQLCKETEMLFALQDLGLQQLTLAEARAHFLWEDSLTCSVGDVSGVGMFLGVRDSISSHIHQHCCSQE